MSGCGCRPPVQLGIDVLRIGSLAKTMRHDRFLRHLYAPEELAHADSLGDRRRGEFLHGRFAAKEAIAKVLGIGLFGDAPPHEMAVLRNAKGAPEPVLRGRAAHHAAVAGIAGLTLSIFPYPRTGRRRGSRLAHGLRLPRPGAGQRSVGSPAHPRIGNDLTSLRTSGISPLVVRALQGLEGLDGGNLDDGVSHRRRRRTKIGCRSFLRQPGATGLTAWRGSCAQPPICPWPSTGPRIAPGSATPS
ncbi:4'-phosphopantetheinyl transferase superfamily protein [Streptomyces sp. S1A(2023)]